MGDLEPAGRTPELPPDVAARIQQAAGKGQVALLVVDARGSLLVGIKGTGGMTEARHDAEYGWTFRVHLGRGAQILDGSYVLRPAGDGRPDDFEDEPEPKPDDDQPHRSRDTFSGYPARWPRTAVAGGGMIALGGTYVPADEHEDRWPDEGDRP